jgi:hypothetical protein
MGNIVFFDVSPCGLAETLHFITGALKSVQTAHCNLPAAADKGKGQPRTEHEGPEGEQRYISTLSLT